ncbi:beta-ketoacyl synthase chain length factor [Aliamphritea ceti]|uniref:beta-ketoacyl synthase chain length factor n=1 Tax=Aliamphritea ceti TaxID=1524258 RepID=UPI0021C317BC|nr:beta-ketoacyl synthase chain length factor [Aliamphritea ceti]
MLRFNIDAWNAYAPGLEGIPAWQDWFANPVAVNDAVKPAVMKAIPAMLRRRFTPLGKVAMGAALPLLDGIDSIPSVFASRHGDTPLTLDLLQEIGRDEPMSPTAFSLAVHNAVGGLYSIARKDQSPINAIAASKGLVVQALLEVICQLQVHGRVLCVIYDVVLPSIYQAYCRGPEFPLALAMIISRDGDNIYELEQNSANEKGVTEDYQDTLKLIAMLLGKEDVVSYQIRQSQWTLNRGCK